jgi:hypothetical protein
MVERKQQKGELFSRLNIERGAPTQDSLPFRTRLAGFLENYYTHAKPVDIAQMLKTELGVSVGMWSTSHGVYYDIPKFFEEARIGRVGRHHIDRAISGA